MDAFDEAIPGFAVVWVALVAALPARAIMLQSRRGRARSAVAYLAGLGAGLVMALVIGIGVGFFKVRIPTLMPLALFAAFAGPFVGLARAVWLRPHSGRSRVP